MATLWIPSVQKVKLCQMGLCDYPHVPIQAEYVALALRTEAVKPLNIFYIAFSISVPLIIITTPKPFFRLANAE